MNKTLFRMEWKSAWKLLLIFILILAMYFSIMLTTVSYTHLTLPTNSRV